MAADDSNEQMLDQLAGLYDVKLDELEEASPDSLPLYSILKTNQVRYHNESLIASGGMKDILKVDDEKTGRTIAMARLHTNAPEELYEPFLREARLTALLDHPNIINIYDIGLDDKDCPYFTMELKNGHGLNELISQSHDIGKDTLSKTNNLLEIFIKICDAVSYAHSQDILHLDLKPENIQVGTFGEVIVCDWGLGKIIGKAENDVEFDQLLLNPDLLNNMTLTGEIKGTPGYMAPEQVSRDGEKTKQTDIYALGSILCSILSGKTAIEGDTETVLDRTLKGELIIPATEGLPNSLRAVILKALKLDPKERYGSVKELRLEVHNYLTGYATNAENAGSAKQLSLFLKRHRLLCSLSLVFAMALSAATLWFIFNLNESRLLAEQAKTNAEQAQEIAEQEKQQAENNLKLYLKGQEKISSMATFRSRELVKESRIYRNIVFFQQPVKFINAALEKIDKAIKIKPADKNLHSDRGSILFMKQNFKEALKAFEIDATKNEDLFKHCKRLSQQNLRGDGLLTLQQLIEVIGTFKFKVNYYEHFVAYDAIKRKNLKDYDRVILALIKLVNEKGDVHLDYNQKAKRISFHGKNAKHLTATNNWSSKLCFLRFLPIERLVLSHSQFTNLNELKGLTTLKDLDLRHSPVTDITPLKRIPSLSKLIIFENQFTPQQLAILSKRVQVKAH